jgi:hypothetical protein
MSSDVTGYIYLGGDEDLAGYELNWEYPSGWLVEGQALNTEQLAYEYPSQFEAITTPFPTPARPRPPRK